MALLKTGTTVRLVQPVVQGEITGASIVDDEVQYKVEYVDANGERQERFFTESVLEVI